MRTAKSCLRRALHRADHLEHREPAAIAAIQHLALAAGAQIAERVEMRADEIGHVDIVADAGAVRRRIVGAEHFEIRPLAERRFARDLDEMRGARRRLAAPPERIGAGDIEIAQGHIAQIGCALPCRAA